MLFLDDKYPISSAKEEKVVKPPKKPMVKKTLSSADGDQ